MTAKLQNILRMCVEQHWKLLLWRIRTQVEKDCTCCPVEEVLKCCELLRRIEWLMC